MRPNRSPRAWIAGAALLAASLSGGTGVLAAGPLDDAMAAFRAGEFEKAATLAASVPADDPSKPKALYVAGEAELARERWDAAAESFRAVLAAKKDNAPATTGLGRALAGKGEKAEAEKTLRRALEIDAKDLGARRALGEFLTATARAEDAVKVLAAAPAKPVPGDALWARAVVEAHLGAGKLDDAGKAAKAFGQEAQGTAMAHFLRALVLDRKNEDRDAIEAYEKALEKEPRFLDAHKNLAILCIAQNPLYTNQERTAKAMKHFDRYFALGGRDAEVKRIYETLRQFIQAR